jgi:hypothetical protein
MTYVLGELSEDITLPMAVDETAQVPPGGVLAGKENAPNPTTATAQRTDGKTKLVQQPSEVPKTRQVKITAIKEADRKTIHMGQVR